jgi:hypothetical protein
MAKEVRPKRALGSGGNARLGLLCSSVVEQNSATASISGSAY